MMKIKQNVTNHLQQWQVGKEIAPYVGLSGKFPDDLGLPSTCVNSSKRSYFIVEADVANSTSNYVLYYGLCFTSLCSASELYNATSFLVDFILEQRKQLNSTTVTFISPNLNTQVTLQAIIFIILFLLIIVIAMKVDFSRWFKLCKENSDQDDDQLKKKYSINFGEDYDPSILASHEEETFFQKISISKKINSYVIPEETDKILSFSAFKILSLPLIIYGYSFYLGNRGSFNFFSFQFEIYQDLYAKLALMAYYLPDIFFYISGFLFAKKAFHFAEIKDGCYDNLFRLFLRKIIKLYPLYIVAVVIYWTITPSLHSGPVWYVYEGQAQQCDSSWWRVFLLVDNWFTYGCYDWAWFIPAEIQLSILNLAFFFVYYKSKKVGLTLLFLTTLAFWVLLLTISSPLPSSVDITLEPETMRYFKSMHSHAPFYFAGILFAYCYTKEKLFHFLSRIASNKYLNFFTNWLAIGIIILILLRPEIWQNILGFELGLTRIGIFLSIFLMMFPSTFTKSTRNTTAHKLASLTFPIILFIGMITSSAFWCSDSFPYLSFNHLMEVLIPNLLISMVVGWFIGILFSSRFKTAKEEAIHKDQTMMY